MKYHVSVYVYLGEKCVSVKTGGQVSRVALLVIHSIHK